MLGIVGSYRVPSFFAPKHSTEVARSAKEAVISKGALGWREDVGLGVRVRLHGNILNPKP